jgi:CelD/BcsL family acetyltransferase involved in cellulose biosynthesis
MRVSEITDRVAFRDLAPEWDSLVQATRDEIFYHHALLRTWVEHFAPQGRLRILVGRDAQGTLQAVLPLLEERGVLFGAPVRQLTAMANPHTPRFDLIAADPGFAGRAFFAHLARTPGWDVLRIMDVPEGGAAWQLYRAAQAAGFPVGVWPSLQSPYIPLPASYDALQDRLPARFKSNLRRRRKKLAALGTVTVERVAGGAALDQKLAEGYAVEQSGWKGREGTAIAQDGPTRGFYSALAHQAAAAGQLALYFLRLEGRAVAWQYGLAQGGRYYLLKPAYDEAYKECSPGHLLMDEVLQDCIARGLHEFDFLGPDMEWKREWAEAARRHHWLFVFRNSPYGQALCAVKFKWWPVAKARMAEWRK